MKDTSFLPLLWLYSAASDALHEQQVCLLGQPLHEPPFTLNIFLIHRKKNNLNT